MACTALGLVHQMKQSLAVGQERKSMQIRAEVISRRRRRQSFPWDINFVCVLLRELCVLYFDDRRNVLALGDDFDFDRVCLVGGRRSKPVHQAMVARRARALRGASLLLGVPHYVQILCWYLSSGVFLSDSRCIGILHHRRWHKFCWLRHKLICLPHWQLKVVTIDAMVVPFDVVYVLCTGALIPHLVRRPV